MTLTPAQKARLPKASLIRFEWHNRWPIDYRSRSPFFIKWRSANAWGCFLGPLMIVVRAPWLEHAARALHPDIFAEHAGSYGSPEGVQTVSLDRELD